MENKTLDNAIEAANAGSKALEHITDIFNKIAGPLASEIGMMLGDKARVYRMKNWIHCQKRIVEMLEDADPHGIPPRQFLPMLEASSLEDDAALQEMWAALIANAATSTAELPTVFITFLREISPFEARTLTALWKSMDKRLSEIGIRADEEVSYPRSCLLYKKNDLLELLDDMLYPTNRSLGTIETIADGSIANILRLGILEICREEGEEDDCYCFTALGWYFLESCQAPNEIRKRRYLY
jgi:hypothetical protein